MNTGLTVDSNLTTPDDVPLHAISDGYLDGYWAQVDSNLDLHVTTRQNGPWKTSTLDGYGNPINSTTDATGSTGLDVVILSPSIPTIQNISVTTANTELSCTLPIDSKRFIVRVREGDTKVRLAFVLGGTSTNYFTISPGTAFSEMDVNASSIILYFNANKAPRTIEVLSWSL